MTYQKWKCIGGDTSPGDGDDTSGGGGNGGDSDGPTVVTGATPNDDCPQESYQ